MEKTKIVSIDWCKDEITERLPWDEDQFITVRRLTGREKRRRMDIASSIRVGSEQSEDYEVNMKVGEVKEFEWRHCITNFLLKDESEGVYKYNSKDAEANQEIYDHISGELEKFIDELIEKVNKEDKEVEEVAKNSSDS